MKSFRLDPDSMVLGSALRRAIFHLLEAKDLRYDPLRPAAMNDLIFGEIVQVCSRPFKDIISNDLERLYPGSSGIMLRTERISLGPCIGVIGNRYAPPYLIGGLTHPVTGQPNGEIRGGAVVDSLFGVNAIGYVNHEADPEERARIKVHGVIVDELGRSVNLSRFREVLDERSAPHTSHTSLIAVAGHSTNAGKTTCAWALASELRKRGFRVMVEKKTGTACCRDWLRCGVEPGAGPLENEGDEFSFIQSSFPARDFVDALGIASDVSAETRTFVTESVRYTRAFLSRVRPDFHVIELADSISHISNTALLKTKYFRDQIDTLVYAPMPTHEAAAHCAAYFRSLGYGETQLLLSGPLANESRYEMAREEIQERLGLPVCRSAIKENGRWIAEGSQLVGELLKQNGARANPIRTGS